MRTKLLISIFLVILFLGCKKENKCIEGNCINGVGVYQFASGGIDSGQFVDGRLNGAGKRVYGETDGGRFSGDMYVGEFKDGYQDGFGTYYFKKEHARHTGMWLEGKPHGKNKVIFDSASIYGKFTFYGTWENGECPEYKKFIRTSKNEKYVFFNPANFYDSVLSTADPALFLIENDMKSKILDIYEYDLSKENVRFEDINEFIKLLNVCSDTLKYAIKCIYGFEEFDKEIPLQKNTLELLEFFEEEINSEVRQWTMKMQYKPSDQKSQRASSEIDPSSGKRERELRKKFNEAKTEFEKKYSKPPE